MVENFFQAFLSFLVDIFFFVMKIITTVIFVPITGLIWSIFPSFDFFSLLGDFTNKVINGIGFAKEVFLNVTGFPRPLFYAFITFFFARFLLTSSIRAVVCIKNLYKLLKEGD